MKLHQITPEFVGEIPRELNPGKLYVCCRYRAIKHLCACGCGVEINTPLHPTGWTLTCDGVSVSLSPSIGSWSEKCQSHYWIINNKIRWAPKFSKHQILQTRKIREWEREWYFRINNKPKTGHSMPPALRVYLSLLGVLTRLFDWILRRK